jgi:type IV secretion system protein TrbJ
MRRKSWCFAVGLAAALVWTPPAHSGGIPVIDPTNLAQNILQAARSLEQIHNQIQQIEQQAQMLAHNPLQLSPELTQSISQARQLFARAQGLSFEVEHLSDQMQTLYPDTFRDFDLGQIGARTNQWLAEDRTSLERAMQAEAQAAQAMEGTQSRIASALQSSGNAEGQTSAVQASNQLLGIQASQLAQIQALLVAQGRALSEERLERVAREQRAQEIMRRAFPTQSIASLTPARSAFEH